MSKEAIEAIIGKAVYDSRFREALFADPDKALAGYDLTTEELAGLKSIDAESMGAMAGALDERISKSAVSLKFPTKGDTPPPEGGGTPLPSKGGGTPLPPKG